MPYKGVNERERDSSVDPASHVPQILGNHSFLLQDFPYLQSGSSSQVSLELLLMYVRFRQGLRVEGFYSRRA